MRMSQRLLAFMWVLLYSAALVGACFFIWSLEQISPVWRSIMIAGVVVGWSWSLTEDMTVDRVSALGAWSGGRLPRR
jgi:hypothetical protein